MDLIEFAEYYDVLDEASISISIPPYDIKSIVNNMEHLVVEFMPDFDEGIDSGSVFLVLPDELCHISYYNESLIPAFDFYSKQCTEQDRAEAIADGSYHASDYRDSIDEITICRAVKNIQDLSQVIRYWLNRYCYTDTRNIHDTITLIHNGVHYQI